jgi:hypothetical protein
MDIKTVDAYDLENEKLCECGCQQPTKFNRQTARYNPFIYRHHSRGKNNPRWKGDNVGYGALHDWVRKYLSKPDLCPKCNVVAPYNVANLSGKYLRDLSDWEWLCVPCHMVQDGRMTTSYHLTQSRKMKISLALKGRKTGILAEQWRGY